MILLLVRPLAGYLPVASMAAVLFIVAWGLIDIRAMRRVWRTSRADALTLAVTFIATLTIRLEVAILVGVLVSLLIYLNWATHPQVVRVVPDPACTTALPVGARPDSLLCPQLDMLRIDGALFFGSVEHIRDEIEAARASRPATRHLLLIGTGVNLIDNAGAELLAYLARSLREAGVELYLCRLRPTVHALLDRGRRSWTTIGRDHVFATKDQAIAVDLSEARCGEMRGVHRAHLHRVPGDAARRQPARQAAARVAADAARRLNLSVIANGNRRSSAAASEGSRSRCSCIAPASPCRVFESASEIRPLGVGINILPHASRELAQRWASRPSSTRVAVLTREAVFFNRFGQLIYREPLGRDAGYDASAVLDPSRRAAARAARRRRRADRRRSRARPAGRASASTRMRAGATRAVSRRAQATGAAGQRADALVACDGLHSVDPQGASSGRRRAALFRRQHVARRFGVAADPHRASMIRAGWLATGKMVIYPIRDDVDDEGRQLVNWVAGARDAARIAQRDWTRPGALDDFIGAFEDWHFDWLDVPAMIRAADTILEFPMVDQDPLPWWTQGRVTLLGDAAHPMYPRGSNGAGQAILDARALCDALVGDRGAARRAEGVRGEAAAGDGARSCA